MRIPDTPRCPGPTISRNHNPRVGGSNPSPATRSKRHFPSPRPPVWALGRNSPKGRAALHGGATGAEQPDSRRVSDGPPVRVWTCLPASGQTFPRRWCVKGAGRPRRGAWCAREDPRKNASGGPLRTCQKSGRGRFAGHVRAVNDIHMPLPESSPVFLYELGEVME